MQGWGPHMAEYSHKHLQRIAAAAPILAAIYRHGSFTLAAQELGVQPSAISHKIRHLEEQLGVALFTRTTRKVTPTRQGLPLCKASQDATTDIVRALQNLDRQDQNTGIVLSLSSSLAMKWLVPAMGRASTHGLQVTLNISDSLSDLGVLADAQVAIRFGEGPYPGLHAHALSKCEAIPVASPDNARALRLKRAKPTLLLRDTRAEQDDPDASWAQYLGEAEYHSAQYETSHRFERTDLAIQAAIGGLGHAMGRTLLVETDLQAGLIHMSGPPFAIKSRYWLVTTPDFAGTQSYANLANWLTSEVDRSHAILQRTLPQGR